MFPQCQGSKSGTHYRYIKIRVHRSRLLGRPIGGRKDRLRLRLRLRKRKVKAEVKVEK